MNFNYLLIIGLSLLEICWRFVVSVVNHSLQVLKGINQREEEEIYLV